MIASQNGQGRRALVAGHGPFPEGMVQTVAGITGRSDAFVVLSNHGLDGGEIDRRMRELIERHDVRVIFTDLPGGSATLAARRIAASREGLTIVVGANLPVLLEYVFRAETADADAACRAAEKGRNAIAVFGVE